MQNYLGKLRDIRKIRQILDFYQFINLFCELLLDVIRITLKIYENFGNLLNFIVLEAIDFIWKNNLSLLLLSGLAESNQHMYIGFMSNKLSTFRLFYRYVLICCKI